MELWPEIPKHTDQASSHPSQAWQNQRVPTRPCQTLPTSCNFLHGSKQENLKAPVLSFSVVKPNPHTTATACPHQSDRAQMHSPGPLHGCQELPVSIQTSCAPSGPEHNCTSATSHRTPALKAHQIVSCQQTDESRGLSSRRHPGPGVQDQSARSWP